MGGLEVAVEAGRPLGLRPQPGGLSERLPPSALVTGGPHHLPARHVVELQPLGLGGVGPAVPLGRLAALALNTVVNISYQKQGPNVL